MDRLMALYTRLIDANPHVATAWWRMHVRLAEVRGRESVVVYQMGKVGSSTIVASLRAQNPRRQIHHVHTLTRKGIADAEAVYHAIERNTGENVTARSRHLWSSRYLRTRMQRPLQGEKWKIITLVREPIARNLSSFFQTIDYPLPNFMARYEAGELSLDTVREVFLQQFDHGQVLRWLDEEVQRALGINVYTEDFPQARGYQIYAGEQCDLLLLKLEKLNECAAQAMHEFLGIEDFTLIKTNVAREKEYADAYRRLRNQLQLPDYYIRTIYASQYMRHFYSRAEIAEFTAKWRDAR
jgi:hypothetical protein